MGGGGIEVPAPTQEEKDLQREQIEILRQQRDIIESQSQQQNLLAPFLYQGLGLTPTIDPETGDITSFEQSEDFLKRQDIQSQLLERSRAALAGELPADPGLLRSIEEGETDLRERLFRQLGTDYETSSPGIEALSEFEKRKQEILDAARRGDLTLAESLGQARDVSNIGAPQAIFSQSTPIAQLFGQSAAGFQNPLTNMFNQRQLALQADIAAAQFDPLAQALGGAGQLAGQLGSAAIFASSEELKEDIEPIEDDSTLEKFGQIFAKKWRYKGDSAKHVGPMAESFKEVFEHGDGRSINVIDAIGELFAGVGALARKVQES